MINALMLYFILIHFNFIEAYSEGGNLKDIEDEINKNYSKIEDLKKFIDEEKNFFREFLNITENIKDNIFNIMIDNQKAGFNGYVLKLRLIYNIINLFISIKKFNKKSLYAMVSVTTTASIVITYKVLKHILSTRKIEKIIIIGLIMLLIKKEKDGIEKDIEKLVNKKKDEFYKKILNAEKEIIEIEKKNIDLKLKLYDFKLNSKLSSINELNQIVIELKGKLDEVELKNNHLEKVVTKKNEELEMSVKKNKENLSLVNWLDEGGKRLGDENKELLLKNQENNKSINNVKSIDAEIISIKNENNFIKEKNGMLEKEVKALIKLNLQNKEFTKYIQNKLLSRKSIQKSMKKILEDSYKKAQEAFQKKENPVLYNISTVAIRLKKIRSELEPIEQPSASL